MLILLDENLPHRFRHLLVGHDVRTTVYQGWSALANGALLKAAESAGFDIVVTADQGIRYQQNLTNLRVALIVLSDSKEPRLIANVHRILDAIRTVEPGTVIRLQLID